MSTGKRSLAHSGIETSNALEQKSKKRKKSHRSSSTQKTDDDEDKNKYIDHPNWKYLRISQQDFYRLHTEFSDWALKIHSKFLDEISTKKCKKLFKKFIRKWNDGKLEQKYYQTFSSLSVDNREKTRYKWSFEKNIKAKEQMDLDLVRDAIDNQTNDINVANKEAEIFQQRFEKRRNKHKKERKPKRHLSEKEIKDLRHDRKQRKYLERQEKEKEMMARYQSFVSSSPKKRKQK